MAQTTKDTPKGASSYKEYSAPHADLREWLDRTEAMGELQKIDGADWNLEIGASCQMLIGWAIEGLESDRVGGLPLAETQSETQAAGRRD